MVSVQFRRLWIGLQAALGADDWDMLNYGRSWGSPRPWGSRVRDRGECSRLQMMVPGNAEDQRRWFLAANVTARWVCALQSAESHPQPHSGFTWIHTDSYLLNFCPNDFLMTSSCTRHLGKITPPWGPIGFIREAINSGDRTFWRWEVLQYSDSPKCGT